jgi:UDP-N-acetylglucosamine/UDP-N-acetylgalactosamine diphosphorylase
MSKRLEEVKAALEQNGQEHVLRFWSDLDEAGRKHLLDQLEAVDFSLMNRLVEQWVRSEPPSESFDEIRPVPTLPIADGNDPQAREAWEAGEEALRAGRVGLLLVAGGQGTRLGFDGPKGAYPVGPLTGKTLFEYHADKIHNLQNRYGCTLPWYIMVSEANAEATKSFFEEHDYFGLGQGNVYFFQQRMVPCVDESGKFMLDAPDHLAENPNGHGGVIPATVENGIIEDCTRRGVDTLSYFQVDNWAVKVADPHFIGYHVLGNGEMSSKVHRRNEPREAVGVHCLCDGEYRVIEYSALDIYPQLLDTLPDGTPKYYAGNPAIHIISTQFISRVFDNYEQFPWWRAHKKIPRLDEKGHIIKPDEPNGFKFETFVFDALRFIKHEPIALEIARLGEYTPIKQFEGSNSVLAARASMNELWSEWLEAAGSTVPRDAEGNPAVDIEISPRLALYRGEFVEKRSGASYSCEKGVAIDGEGRQLSL